MTTKPLLRVPTLTGARILTNKPLGITVPAPTEENPNAVEELDNPVVAQTLNVSQIPQYLTTLGTYTLAETAHMTNNDLVFALKKVLANRIAPEHRSKFED